MWDPATGRLVHVLHVASGPVNGVAFSPNGRLLAGADMDGTVRLWDPATGQPIRVLHIASGPNGAGWVAFSPHSGLLATVTGTGAVQLWNPVTGQAVGAPFGQSNLDNEVGSVTFSPDGRLLASADSAGTVRFWEVSAFINPYAALCADVGAPTQQEWRKYAGGEPQPSVCT